MELNNLTAHELIKLLNKGDISPIDICNILIEIIEKKDKKLNALANFDKKKVLERCSALKKEDKSKV